RRRHTRSKRDWSSDVCSSDLPIQHGGGGNRLQQLVKGGLIPLLLRLSQIHIQGLPRQIQLQITGGPAGLGGGEQARHSGGMLHRSEERRVGKEGRSRVERDGR